MGEGVKPPELRPFASTHMGAEKIRDFIDFNIKN